MTSQSGGYKYYKYCDKVGRHQSVVLGTVFIALVSSTLCGSHVSQELHSGVSQPYHSIYSTCILHSVRSWDNLEGISGYLWSKSRIVWCYCGAASALPYKWSRLGIHYCWNTIIHVYSADSTELSYYSVHNFMKLRWRRDVISTNSF